MQDNIGKVLTSKTRLSDWDDVYEFCLNLWDDLAPAVIDTKDGFSVSREDGALLKENRTMVRLALLADFYRYQGEDLQINTDRARRTLVEIKAVAADLTEALWGPTAASSTQPEPRDRFAEGERKRKPHRGLLSTPKRARKCAGDYGVRWSRLSFSGHNKTYFSKLANAFQVVKNTGYPSLVLQSEWGLSCYYRLATAYTTDRPLELAAACLPELREAAGIIRDQQFHRLNALPSATKTLLYAVLNCHINWIDYNHKQILLIPGTPSPGVPPREEGDLRCLRCLKNQTFHSSEVKGNPRNIDVEFVLESMTFASSCCRAPVVNVPLTTATLHTCTFTDMKQMYTACPKCKLTVFSEVLVDLDTLRSRCVTCTR